MSGNCECCEALSLMMKSDKNILSTGYSAKYYVSFVEEIYKGKQFRGQAQYFKFPIKYCPVCGKEIKDE